MSTENLVNIDIESDGTHHEYGEESSANQKINNNRNYQKVLSEESEIIFSCDNILDDCDRLGPNESQPLLGLDHHDGHQIIYNQFPSEYSA